MTNETKTSSVVSSLSGVRGKIIKPSQVKAGNTVRIHQKIVEITPKGEEKERIQIFEGMVIGVRGGGISKTMTVRKISEGVSVEKILPLSLPSIVAIELTKTAKVRRARLSYLRKSKKRLKEKMV